MGRPGSASPSSCPRPPSPPRTASPLACTTEKPRGVREMSSLFAPGKAMSSLFSLGKGMSSLFAPGKGMECCLCLPWVKEWNVVFVCPG